MQSTYTSNTRSGASRGFTLVELLVVTTIIALPAAILFPAFVQSREASESLAHTVDVADSEGSRVASPKIVLDEPFLATAGGQIIKGA